MNIVCERRSLRIQGYDYSTEGYYFVTLCTQDRMCLLGEVVDGEMRLNEWGGIVEKCWRDIPNHFDHAIVDEFVIMPNHFHGIISISHDVGAPFMAPKRKHLPGAINGAPTLGDIVRAFKARSTRQIRLNHFVQFSWQRNYYERVVRNEAELLKAREYIQNNPLKWELDPENPARKLHA